MRDMDQPVLHTHHLEVGYGGKALLEEVCLAVHPGQILTLIGPNGVGKSTLLKTLSKLLAPVGGAVLLQGKELRQLPERELALQLSILTTERVMPELMRCEEVVGTGRYPHTGRLGLLTPADRAQVDAAMELVGVQALRDQEFRRLSDGQRQRVMLARAICQEPDIIVLDEPTSFLDIRYKLEFLSILQRMSRSRNLSVIMSLHELELAGRISDKLLCVKGDKVDRFGTPEEVFTPGYISELYGMTAGSYDEATGNLELEAVKKDPEIFVIAGNGTGTALFRKLQREGISFAAGILWENDLDCPAARALASAAVEEKAFCPIGAEKVERAKELIDACGSAICTLDLDGAGEWAKELRELAAYAGRKGKLKAYTVLT